MGTGASFAYDTDGLLKPEQVQNARLQQDMLDYVAQLDRKGMKVRFVGVCDAKADSYFHTCKHAIGVQVTGG